MKDSILSSLEGNAVNYKLIFIRKISSALSASENTHHIASQTLNGSPPIVSKPPRR